jgi:hypothetical protein
MKILACQLSGKIDEVVVSKCQADDDTLVSEWNEEEADAEAGGKCDSVKRRVLERNETMLEGLETSTRNQSPKTISSSRSLRVAILAVLQPAESISCLADSRRAGCQPSSPPLPPSYPPFASERLIGLELRYFNAGFLVSGRFV